MTTEKSIEQIYTLNEQREIKKVQVGFINTEQEPIKIKHICFYTELSGHEVLLYKVEEFTYPHPDTDMMNISVIKSRLVGTKKQNEFEAAPYMILHYAQQNAVKAR